MTDEIKQEEKKRAVSGRNGQPVPTGGGRKKGIPNKLTTDLRDMIRKALDKAGGLDYLVNQAHENPKAFLALLSKIIPAEIHATLDSKITRIEVLVSDSSKPDNSSIDVAPKATSGIVIDCD